MQTAQTLAPAPWNNMIAQMTGEAPQLPEFTGRRMVDRTWGEPISNKPDMDELFDQVFGADVE